jgi:hypothetical protein
LSSKVAVVSGGGGGLGAAICGAPAIQRSQPVRAIGAQLRRENGWR